MSSQNPHVEKPAPGATIIFLVQFIMALIVCIAAHEHHFQLLMTATIVMVYAMVFTSWMLYESLLSWLVTFTASVVCVLNPHIDSLHSVTIILISTVLQLIILINDKQLQTLEETLQQCSGSVRALESDHMVMDMNIRNLKEKIARLAQFKKLLETLKEKLDIDHICDTILTGVDAMIAKGDCIRLYQLADDMSELRLTHQLIVNPRLSLPEHDDINLQVLRTASSLLISHDQSDTGHLLHDLASQSVVCAPLISGNKLYGMLRIDSAFKYKFNAIDQRFLAGIAHLGSLALANARLFDTAKTLASTDSLTGLNTHRFFKEQLELWIERAEPFSILFIDVDNFKQINDRFGHPVGDMVLRNVGAVLKKICGNDRIISRYGGEEFAVLTPHTQSAERVDVAETICTEITDMIFTIRRSRLSLSVSIGVATYPDTAQTAIELLRQADHALYQAKSTGKNRVVRT